MDGSAWPAAYAAAYGGIWLASALIAIWVGRLLGGALPSQALVTASFAVLISQIALACLQHVLSALIPQLVGDSDDLPGPIPAVIVISAILRTRHDAKQAAEASVDLAAATASEKLPVILAVDFGDAAQAVEAADADLLAVLHDTLASSDHHLSPKGRIRILVRDRQWNPVTACWMGRERKRGKIEDVLWLLQGHDPGVFREPAQVANLVGVTTYAMLVDVDTRLLDGTIRRLFRRMEMLGEDGPAIACPRIEVLRSGHHPILQKALFGTMEPDLTPAGSVSVRQVITGVDLFVGKGLVRISTFLSRLDGRVPPGRILSHDHVEGMIAGVVLEPRAVVTERAPSSLAAWWTRQERWIRGDIQNVIVFLLRWRVPSSVSHLKPRDQVELANNILTHLYTPAWMIGFVALVLAGQPGGASVMATVLTPRWLLLAQQAFFPVARQPRTAVGRALWRQETVVALQRFILAAAHLSVAICGLARGADCDPATRLQGAGPRLRLSQSGSISRPFRPEGLKTARLARRSAPLYRNRR